MCFGPELAIAAAVAGSALSAGGTLISNREAQADAQRRARARNAELEQFRARNKQRSDEAYAAFDEVNKTFEAPDQAKILADEAAARGTQIEKTIGEMPTVNAAAPASAPKVVGDSLSSAINAAMQRSKARGQAQANLGAYGDTMFRNTLNKAKAGRSIDTMRAFSASDANLLPHLQDLAEASATRPSSGTGQIMSGIGKLFAGASGRMYG